MALGATIYRLQLTLSDVDRCVYETLDLRVARHPSESARYLWLRILAYALEYEEGIEFSKGGVSSSEEPPVAIRDATGAVKTWIEIGSPSAERLHKVTKAAERVVLFTATEVKLLEREARSREIHRLDSICVRRIDPKLLQVLEAKLERNLELELVHNSGMLYLRLGNDQLEIPIEEVRL